MFSRQRLRIFCRSYVDFVSSRRSRARWAPYFNDGARYAATGLLTQIVGNMLELFF